MLPTVTAEASPPGGGAHDPGVRLSTPRVGSFRRCDIDEPGDGSFPVATLAQRFRPWRYASDELRGNDRQPRHRPARPANAPGRPGSRPGHVDVDHEHRFR